MTIRPRSDWGSIGTWGYVRKSNRKRNKVVVHHSVTNLAGKTPVEQVKEEEDIHYALRDSHGFGAISYNHVVSRDGQQWEGRGWADVTDANWWGDDTIAICVAGNYHPNIHGVETLTPNAEQLQGVAEIIYEGMTLGWITPDAKLIGHRQAGKTSCPGDNLFNALDQINAALHKIILERGEPDLNVTPPFEIAPAVLKLGSKGAAVKNLQTTLNMFAKANLVVDGDFGNKTRDAVIAYQTKLHVTADGVWGPASTTAQARFVRYLADLPAIAHVQASTPAVVASTATVPLSVLQDMSTRLDALSSELKKYLEP